MNNELPVARPCSSACSVSTVDVPIHEHFKYQATLINRAEHSKDIQDGLKDSSTRRLEV
jgi:hypothetical protein